MRFTSVIDALRERLSDIVDSGADDRHKAREIGILIENTLSKLVLYPVIWSILEVKSRNNREFLNKGLNLIDLYQSDTLGPTLHALESLIKASDELTLVEPGQGLLSASRLRIDDYEHIRIQRNKLSHYNVGAIPAGTLDHGIRVLTELLGYADASLSKYELIANSHPVIQAGANTFRMASIQEIGSEPCDYQYAIFLQDDRGQFEASFFFSNLTPHSVKYSPMFDYFKVGDVTVQRKHGKAFSVLTGYLRLEEFRSSESSEEITDSTRYIRDFSNIIDQLTQRFVGRREYLRKLIDWATDGNSRDFWIVGPMGSGKSTLAAQFYRELVELADSQVTQSIYLINKQDKSLANEHTIFRSMIAAACHRLGFKADYLETGDLDSLITGFEYELKTYDFRNKHDRLVFILDGFDELQPDSQKSVWDAVERLMAAGIRFALFSQPINFLSNRLKPQLQIVYGDESNTSDIRLSTEIELSRMPISDEVREVAVKKIVTKAAGQFLMQHYLIKEFERDGGDVLSIDRMPSNVEDYYISLLDRLRRDFESDESFVTLGLTVLTLLSWYGAPLSRSSIASILGLHVSKVNLVIENFEHLLVKSDDAGEDNYSFVHNSLKNFLLSQSRITDLIPDVSSGILRYYQTRTDSRFLMENFVRWGNEADDISLLNNFYADAQFVSACIVARSQLVHPAQFVQCQQSDNTSPSDVAVLRLRTRLTALTLRGLAYNQNEYELTSFLYSKPKAARFMIDAHVLPSMPDELPVVITSELEQSLLDKDESALIESLCEYKLWDRLYDVSMHNSTTDFYDLLQKVHQVVLHEVDRLGPVSGDPTGESLSKLSFVSNEYLRLLCATCSRANRFDHESAMRICKLINEVFSGIISSGKSGRIVLCLFLKNLGPSLRFVRTLPRQTIQGVFDDCFDLCLQDVSEFVERRLPETNRRDIHFEAFFEDMVMEAEDSRLDISEEVLAYLDQSSISEREAASVVAEFRKSQRTSAILRQHYEAGRQYLLETWEAGYDADYPDELIEVPWEIISRLLKQAAVLWPEGPLFKTLFTHVLDNWAEPLEQSQFFRIYHGSGSKYVKRALSEPLPKRGPTEHHFRLLYLARSATSFVIPEPIDGAIDQLCSKLLSEIVSYINAAEDHDDFDQRVCETTLLDEDEYFFEIPEPHEIKSAVCDTVCMKVAREYSATPDQITYLSERFSGFAAKFSALFIPYMDFSCSDHVAEFRKCVLGLLERSLNTIDTVGESDWSFGYGDWFWPQSQEVRYGCSPFSKSTSRGKRLKRHEPLTDESWRSPFFGPHFPTDYPLVSWYGKDFALVWYCLMLHDTQGTELALNVCRKYIEEGVAKEKSLGFLSCYAAATCMCGPSLRRQMVNLYESIFPELVQHTLLPDSERFFNYFFELSDDELGNFIDDTVTDSSGQRCKIWHRVQQYPREAARILESEESDESVVELLERLDRELPG